MALIRLFAALLLATVLAACSGNDNDAAKDDETVAAEDTMKTDERDEAAGNPWLSPSTLPFQMPPFDRIRDEHFVPAMELGMQEALAEVDEIANDDAQPTFDNTIVALERSGQTLARAYRIFSVLNSADTNDARQEIQREISPRLSAHRDAIRLNADLFARIDALYQQRQDLELEPEQLRLLEEYHRDFVRAGARLSDSEKERLRGINGELAKHGVLAECTERG